MSTADLPDQPGLPDPVRGRLERAIDFNRRYAALAGLALWGAAGAVLALHGTGHGFPDPTRFALTDTWLVGVGCTGCPMLPMRALGRFLTPHILVSISAVLFGMAALLTALMLGGQMHPKPLTAVFAVILPLAGAIQTLDAAHAELHARSREERAYRKGRLETLASVVAQSRSALAGLDRLEAMSVGELEALSETMDILIEEKLAEAPVLHLLPPPAEARRSGAKQARAVPGGRYAPLDHHHN